MSPPLPLQCASALLVVVCGYMLLITTSDVCFLPSCQRCLNAGCGWSGTGCTWANLGWTNVIMLCFLKLNHPPHKCFCCDSHLLTLFLSRHAAGQRLPTGVAGAELLRESDALLTLAPVGRKRTPQVYSLLLFFSAQAPTISSISPDIVSFYGKNQAALRGWNLGDVTGVRIQASMDCKPEE